MREPSFSTYVSAPTISTYSSPGYHSAGTEAVNPRAQMRLSSSHSFVYFSYIIFQSFLKFSGPPLPHQNQPPSNSWNGLQITGTPASLSSVSAFAPLSIAFESASYSAVPGVRALSQSRSSALQSS